MEENRKNSGFIDWHDSADRFFELLITLSHWRNCRKPTIVCNFWNHLAANKERRHVVTIVTPRMRMRFNLHPARVLHAFAYFVSEYAYPCSARLSAAGFSTPVLSVLQIIRQMATRINLRNWKLFKAWCNFVERLLESSRDTVYMRVPSTSASNRGTGLSGQSQQIYARRRVIFRKSADATILHFHYYQCDKCLSVDKRDLKFARNKIYRFLNVNSFSDYLR